MNAGTQLVALWHERDSRYGTRRVPGMTDAEIEAIRAWRLLEVERLPADDREVCRNIWSQWTPPVFHARQR